MNTHRHTRADRSDAIAERLGEDVIAHEGITDATIIATAIDALREAVLEAAEQLRIANLIALAVAPSMDMSITVIDQAHAALHDDTSPTGALLPDIATALGIEADGRESESADCTEEVTSDE